MLTTQGEVDRSGRGYIERLIADRVCRSAVHVQSSESTNALALRDGQSGIAHELLPRLYVADQQTSGRGRHGRRWHSSDHTITLSLVIASPRPTTLLPIAAGVGVARSVEHSYAPLRAWLKWPNDVYIDQGKVAGILIETNHSHPDRVVVGVGINVGGVPDISHSTTSDHQSRPAEPRSIAGVIGRPLPRYEMLPSLVTHLVSSINDLAGAASSLLSDFRARCLLTDQPISFAGSTGPQTGRCLGINDEGELAVRVGSTIQHCRSGEAHCVRFASPSQATPHGAAKRSP